MIEAMRTLYVATSLLALLAASCSKAPSCEDAIKSLVKRGVVSTDEADELFKMCTGEDSRWNDGWTAQQRKCVNESESNDAMVECIVAPEKELGGRTVVDEFERLKDKMCQCKDKECAESVNKEFEEWLKKNEKAKGSKGQQEKAKKVAEDYTKCMMSAMAASENAESE